MGGQKNIYDLEERTAQFGEKVIRFCRSMPRSEIARRIIDQLIGSSTSVGANYCEADNAESKKSLDIKLGYVKKSLAKQCISCECQPWRFQKLHI